jgi:hypothetical protein
MEKWLRAAKGSGALRKAKGGLARRRAILAQTHKGVVRKRGFK